VSARLDTTLAAWLARGEAAVLVRIAAVRGSTPREAGAAMLVSLGQRLGTVGGGRLEETAIAAAHALLRGGGVAASLDIPLGAAIGQCCGGHVTLRLERATRATVETLAAEAEAERAARPTLYLFGAGHVGRALAHVLAPLPFRLRWIDSRPEEFPAVIPDGVARIVTAHPVDEIALAPPRAGFLVLTHSHALDFTLAEAILRRRDAFYAGLIGSATKRRRFGRWYAARGGEAGDLVRLTCPIGAGIPGDKRPEIIAAMTAAELLMTAAAAQPARAPLPVPAV
jgi:xanthine dehydrogenase accessory protein XdhC